MRGYINRELIYKQIYKSEMGFTNKVHDIAISNRKKIFLTQWRPIVALRWQNVYSTLSVNPQLQSHHI